MALVDSLLSAMVRADGDALVMHVGERPYVVTGDGTLDLSTHGLNLGAMTGMLQQLLPADAQTALEEFGAVEHKLVAAGDDRFNVVAARGGDDIWIEIRRRRDVPAVVEEMPAPMLVTEDPAPIPVVVAEAAEPLEIQIEHTAVVAETEVEPVAHIEVAVEQTEAVAPMVAAPDPVALPEPVSIPEPESIPEPAAMLEPVAAGSEPVAAPAPVAIVESVETQAPMATLEAVEPPESVQTSQPDAPLEAVAQVRFAEAAPAVPIELAAAMAPDAAPQSVPSAFARTDSREPGRDPAEAATGRDAERQPVAEPAARVVLPLTRTARIEAPSRAMSQSRSSTVERLLRLAAARGASALFLTGESRPYIRVEGDIRLLDGEALLSKAEVEAAILEIVPDEVPESVGSDEATEWLAELPELGRIRCTRFNDHRGPGVLFSLIATRAATAEQLGLSREVQALATEAEGLVLVAGPRGSGKSTMMSALVDLVNRQRAEYVITLERQIRLVHDNRTALVSQREVRGGADEALVAARAALRENPDVLVVDDLSSAQMVPLLLEAAADGLLVFVSITAPSTSDAVERLIDLAPVGLRKAIHTAMAEAFRGAVAQVLLKKAGGGRVAAREILLGTAAVTRLIGDGQPGQLPLALESGRRHGMVPMTDVLVGLVQTGVVDVREAFRKTHDRDRLLSGLKREGVDTSIVERLA